MSIPNVNLNVADTNPWLSRARKLLLSLIPIAVGVIEIANVWPNGPTWLYTAAGVISAILIYFVPNAPKFKDPRATAAAQASNVAIH